MVARLGEEAIKLSVPMPIDLKFGRNWADATHSWEELTGETAPVKAGVAEATQQHRDNDRPKRARSRHLARTRHRASRASPPPEADMYIGPSCDPDEQPIPHARATGTTPARARRAVPRRRSTIT